MTEINELTSLEAFDEKLIQKLMDENRPEDMYLEFKEMISAPRGEANHIYRVRKTLAAFANTFGGFIIFGIVDSQDSVRKGRDRIVGINETTPHTELGTLLISKFLNPTLCEPQINIEGPKCVDVDGATIVIFKICRSKGNPHGIRKEPDCPIEFWERGPARAVIMSYASIKDGFERLDKTALITSITLDLEVYKHKIGEMLKTLDGKVFVLPQFAVPGWSYDMANIVKLCRNNKELIDNLLKFKATLEMANYYIIQLSDSHRFWIDGLALRPPHEEIDKTPPKSLLNSRDQAKQLIFLALKVCQEAISNL